MGIPTLSLQLEGVNHGLCVPEKYGAVKVVRDKGDLYEPLAGLLDQGDYRQRYLKRQARFAVFRDGIDRLEHKIYEIVGVN